jgi:hypothetical protein
MDIASLTRHIDSDTSHSLSGDILAVQNFFSNETLRADHINQLNVVSSLIGPILRYVYLQSDSDAKKPKSEPLVVWRTNNLDYTEADSWIFRPRIRVYHSAQPRYRRHSCLPPPTFYQNSRLNYQRICPQVA